MLSNGNEVYSDINTDKNLVQGFTIPISIPIDLGDISFNSFHTWLKANTTSTFVDYLRKTYPKLSDNKTIIAKFALTDIPKLADTIRYPGTSVVLKKHNIAQDDYNPFVNLKINFNHFPNDYSNCVVYLSVPESDDFNKIDCLNVLETLDPVPKITTDYVGKAYRVKLAPYTDENNSYYTATYCRVKAGAFTDIQYSYDAKTWQSLSSASNIGTMETAGYIFIYAKNQIPEKKLIFFKMQKG